MPSEAYHRFETNIADIDRLIEIHGLVTDGKPGRHYQLGALNKSIVIIACAAWEAFVEDLVREAGAHLVAKTEDPEALHDGIKRRIADELREKAGSTKLWILSGSGWKSIVCTAIERLCDGQSGGLNTPDAKKVNDLFRNALGFPIWDDWRWKSMTPERARKKLNQLVKDRNTYAHGAVPDKPVTIMMARGHRVHIEQLAFATDQATNARLEEQCGAPLFVEEDEE